MKPVGRAYLRRNWQLYALLLLPVTYFIVFKYGPIYGILIAFKDYNIFKGIMASPWIGFDAFEQIFRRNDFYSALRNTFLLNGLDLLFSFPAPIVLAILLNELRLPWFKKMTQTIYYLPHFLSWVIIGGMVYQLFSTNTGIVNQVIMDLGFEPVPFLADKNYWLITYLFTGVWQSAGWGTIIYLAAMTGINKELYEAAEVDGAGRSRKMWHITLPGIRSTIVILLIINIGHMASIGFDRPYILGNAMVQDYADVLSTFVYRVGLQSGQYTMATAVGLFQSVVGLVFVLGSNYLSKKVSNEGIF